MVYATQLGRALDGEVLAHSLMKETQTRSNLRQRSRMVHLRGGEPPAAAAAAPPWDAAGGAVPPGAVSAAPGHFGSGR